MYVHACISDGALQIQWREISLPSMLNELKQGANFVSQYMNNEQTLRRVWNISAGVSLKS